MQDDIILYFHFCFWGNCGKFFECGDFQIKKQRVNFKKSFPLFVLQKKINLERIDSSVEFFAAKKKMFGLRQENFLAISSGGIFHGIDICFHCLEIF